MDKALADASAYADDFLRGRYTLPLAGIPRTLTLMVCDIARFYLYDDAATDIVERRYKDAQSWLIKLGLVAVSMLIAVLGPDAYIARRQRMLHASYRLDFPDLLDLMVVCVDAGLGQRKCPGDARVRLNAYRLAVRRRIDDAFAERAVEALRQRAAAERIVDRGRGGVAGERQAGEDVVELHVAEPLARGKGGKVNLVALARGQHVLQLPAGRHG